jgi:hypothetical protein
MSAHRDHSERNGSIWSGFPLSSTGCPVVIGSRERSNPAAAQNTDLCAISYRDPAGADHGPARYFLGEPATGASHQLHRYARYLMARCS